MIKYLYTPTKDIFFCDSREEQGLKLKQLLKYVSITKIKFGVEDRLIWTPNFYIHLYKDVDSRPIKQISSSFRTTSIVN